MNILIIDTYYPSFLKFIRSKYPEISLLSYHEQLRFILNQRFGTSDYYSYNLNKIGYNAQDFIVNDEILMSKWAMENKVNLPLVNQFSKIQSLPFIYRFIGKPLWIQHVALARIKKDKPDVVYLQDLSILNPQTLKEAKKYTKLIVGQIASPLPSSRQLKQFDLIISSIPHFVKNINNWGIRAEYLKLGFETRLLKEVGGVKKKYDVTFIGSFTHYHNKRTKLLEKVSKEIDVNIWGQGIDTLSSFSPLRKYYHGEIWGLDMFRILAQSTIVINHHIDVAGDEANNMRLYETTGMGALLLTDHKKNLNTLFHVGEEIISYSNSEELINKIRYYLQNTKITHQISLKGQKRAIAHHSYLNRMKELAKIIRKYI